MTYANIMANLAIFDELVSLFKNRAPILAEAEFPNVKPHLQRYEFPEDLLDDERLAYALNSSRLQKIRDSIARCHDNDSLIKYVVPWFDTNTGSLSVDMIYSQAALEHVDDLPSTYKAMHSWLKPDGYMSHVIDFSSHGIAHEWNGHWTYSDLIWKLIRGKRPYLINREPRSTHISYLGREGFTLVFEKVTKSESRLTKQDLAARFSFLDDTDLQTRDSFIQAVKKCE